MQDATFSELLRRLRRLDVDPQLPGEVAVAAAPDGDAEDAASQIRAVCQSSADIDFAAALNIACSHRTAKVCTFSTLPPDDIFPCKHLACCGPCNTLQHSQGDSDVTTA
jgi:hypothetical protein